MAVYVDYAATTPIDKEILEAIVSSSEHFGNPSSIHQVGKRAKADLERNRRDIASVIGAKPNEMIMTSGATEANNLAIRGVVESHDDPHIITTKTEHSSVLNTIEMLEKEGKCKVTYLDVGEDGVIDLNELKNALTRQTVLVTIILVNNETGVVEPIYDIQEILKESSAYLHVDAVQAVGHMEIDVEDLGVDFLSLSGHKIYGPKGIGALYHRNGIHLKSMVTGGGHERARRAGTENTLWVYGLALAMTKAKENVQERSLKEMQLKELFLNELTASEIPFEVNGDVNQMSSHIINLHFPWTASEFLLTALDMANVFASGGSACHAGTVQPSHVITEMYDEERANHSIRFSFSHLMEGEDIKDIVSSLKEIYTRLYESKMI